MTAWVEDFVFAEAALLDDGAYEQWLDLWTEECVYWAPFRREVSEPASVVNLIFDDRRRLADRVHRLTGGKAHAQDPPSATSRLMGSVRSSDGGSWRPALDFDRVVEAGFILTELRQGIRRQYTGKSTYWLRGADNDVRMVAKRVDLLEALGPLGNLTVLL